MASSLIPIKSKCVINTASPQANGLVARWAMGEGAGTVVRDDVLKSNGIIGGGVTYVGSEKGNATKFNGTDGRVVLPYSVPWASNRVGMITCWLQRPVGAVNTGRIISRGGTADDAWRSVMMIENSSTLIGFRQYDSVTTNVLQFTFPAPQVGTLFFLAIGMTENGAVGYINGIPSTLTFSFGTSTTRKWFSDVNINTSQRNLIGSFAPYLSSTVGNQTNGFIPSTCFEGKMLDFRIYNRALSPQEVKEIYTNPLGIYAKTYIPFAITSISTEIRRMLMGVGL